MIPAIPIIDLFAGPGGLGEGFSSLENRQNERRFRIMLSIECDQYAHRTLELRAFFRQFGRGDAPSEYYQYVSGQLTRRELFARYPSKAEIAIAEAWLGELGKLKDELVDERIRAAIDTKKPWVLIGGPPCQAYSLVGRSRIRGESQKKYEMDTRHFLYREYLRILAEHAPPVFVMENVKGLLSTTINHERVFQRILADLAMPQVAINNQNKRQHLEYHLFSVVNPNLVFQAAPEDYIVRAEQFGIPQARHRIIILGIRSDLKQEPKSLVPSRAPSIDETISDLPRLRSGLSKSVDSGAAWRNAIVEVTKRDWFLNGAVNNDMRRALRIAVQGIKSDLERGAEYIPSDRRPTCYPDWYFDLRLGGVLNHSSRGHIQEDLHRYLYAAVYALENGRSPLLEDFPRSLLPKHRNVRQALKETKFNDRFRVQVKGRPATTVVSHIAKDGHYFIHYDPTQCRSLTVREAARLQTFPDNYFLEGPRTEQYKQVGNAVPPLLAKQIAEVVADLFA
jgi:DNA (cytosine-5)-methyltransferase 1